MTANHSQAIISAETIAHENQLFSNDLGCQNMFGQNKGQQRYGIITIRQEKVADKNPAKNWLKTPEKTVF